MSSFFIETKPENNLVTIEGHEAHHIVNVRRVVVGDIINLFDSDKIQYTAQVVQTSKKKVVCEIRSQNVIAKKFPIEFYLAQALTKSKVWDIILQKAMELNLENLVPVITENTSAGANSSGKAERWQKIIIAAAKQCEQPSLLEIHPNQKFHDVMSNMTQEHMVLLAHTQANLPSLKTVLNTKDNIKSLVVMIGPEGGFSEKEIILAQEKGAILFSLGDNVLRAETAAIITIANVYFYFSEDNKT